MVKDRQTVCFPRVYSVDLSSSAKFNYRYKEERKKKGQNKKIETKTNKKGF